MPVSSAHWLSPTGAVPAPPRIPRSCVVLFRAGGAGLECSASARRPQGAVAQRASSGCGCDTEPTCRSLSAPHVADPGVLSPLLISLKTEAGLGCYSGAGGPEVSCKICQHWRSVRLPAHLPSRSHASQARPGRMQGECIEIFWCCIFFYFFKI